MGPPAASYVPTVHSPIGEHSKVMSATQSRSDPAAAKSRLTRSGAGAAVGSRRVVRWAFRLLTPCTPYVPRYRL